MKTGMQLASVLVVVQAATVAFGAFDQPITLEEVLGHSWGAAAVHKRVEVPPGDRLEPSGAALFLNNERVPCQLAALETNQDGSVRSADVWFRTDLPANQKKVFVLKDLGKDAAKSGAEPTDLTIHVSGAVLEFKNGRTAVRLPAGEWTAPEGAKSKDEAAAALAQRLGIGAKPGQVAGPLLGVLLPNGIWAAIAYINTDKPVLGYETELLAQGPIFARAQVRFRFADGGRYSTVITLFTDEPTVMIDEQYERVGMLSLEFPAVYRPTQIVYEAFRASRTGKTTESCDLVGWNDVIARMAPAMALVGDASGIMLGLTTTDSEWLSRPYREALHVKIVKGAAPDVQGTLEEPGHRHWAIWTAKEADLIQLGQQPPANEFATLGFDEPCTNRPLVKIFYDQWWRRFVVSSDKIVNWKLTWPDMDKIEFPHTFFGKQDLPTMRTWLQAEPAIIDFITKGAGYLYPDASYLYSGDQKLLVVLRDAYRQPPKRTYDDGPSDHKCLNYLTHAVAINIEHAGYFYYDYMRPMNMTDNLLSRIVGFDLLLGSDLLTAEERRQMLSRIAFLVYLMHDTIWYPTDYAQGRAGYEVGTPNQRHCLFSTRAMVACMLENHPDKPAWIRRALEANDRVMPDSVNTNGVHLESPFYSARDTMRFGPFWTAMTRAGAKGPDAEQWMNREKMTFQYLGDMLTPPEPRMGGRRVYHPIGRSSMGVIDPTFMIGGYPWGLTDPHHGQLMRWLWQSQGKPAPDVMGTTGGRNIALTCLAFGYPFEPLKECPLKSRRWEGMGVVMRSETDTDHESNVLFRHDPFCRELYDENNGGVYFYGKGAPLSVRFGAYWMGQTGQPHLMDIPFGNRVLFEQGGNRCVGRTTDYALLGDLADYAVGETIENDWRRAVLFAKDMSKEDPVYLLVRDDVSRTNSPTALHWWIMSKDVQPDGIEKPGVVPTKGSDEQWWAHVGKNWADALKRKAITDAAQKEAPQQPGDAGDSTPADLGLAKTKSVKVAEPPILKGQHQFFTGQCGVDLDLFIAAPAEPKIVTDAVGVGPRISYCVNQNLYEYQQLVRIEQPAGKSYLTLLMPRWPGAPQPECRTIADGAGVAIKHAGGEDRLFLSEAPVTFEDAVAVFKGRAGFVRHGPAGYLRLMVTDGQIKGDGLSLSCSGSAALVFDGKTVQACSTSDLKEVAITLPDNLKSIPVKITP